MTDSPFSSSRVSKSPAPKSKKEKKSKLDRSKTPKLTAPLSVLTKDMSVPVRDIEAWVNRSVEERRKEVEKRNGYVTRPMNSFMLYRSAYAERTKQWCLQNNHQVVSSVSGESWPMEPEEVRNQFDEWAKTERSNHQAAHPNYKFSPSKSTNKRRKGDFSDDEDDASDLDGDPDGEYKVGGKSTRPKKQAQMDNLYMDNSYTLDSHPYFGQQMVGYDHSQVHYASLSRPLPSNVASYTHGIPYSPQTATYLHATMQQPVQYQYIQDTQSMRAPTPSSLNGTQSLGGFGLPSGQTSPTDLLNDVRIGTPMQQHYHHYGQPIYQQYQAQYQPQAYQQAASATPVSAAHIYEHQQYLQQASQPQAAIDPSLNLELAALSRAGAVPTMLHASHFDDAMGDMSSAEMQSMQEYYTMSPVDGTAQLSRM